jgi:hypothetical protein
MYGKRQGRCQKIPEKSQYDQTNPELSRWSTKRRLQMLKKVYNKIEEKRWKVA